MRNNSSIACDKGYKRLQRWVLPQRHFATLPH